MRRPSRGFTLIELMVVVAIIGLLASVAMPEFNRLVERTRRVSFETSYEQYAASLIHYFEQNGKFPTETSPMFVSEPPLGATIGDISGYSTPNSPFFPGKDIPSKYPGVPFGYDVEPWRSLVGFGAPMIDHSRERYALLSFDLGGGSSLLELYAFHNFNGDDTVGYRILELEAIPGYPGGYYRYDDEYLPDE